MKKFDSKKGAFMKVTSCFIFVLLSFIVSNSLFAVHGRYEEAMRVRSLIEVPNDRVDPNDVAEKYILPVSRGFDQEQTELCWAYATLNVLESSFLARNEGKKIELSRRAMQYFTMEDRYFRHIRGIEKFLSERGTAMDAIRLIQLNGLVWFSDYKDITDPYGIANIENDVNQATGYSQKMQKLSVDLNKVYTDPPLSTHFGDKTLSRGELAKQITNDLIWESYAVLRDGEEGYRHHPDPDARHETVSYYMPRAKFADRIKAALKAKYAVEITIGGHCITIYGADYDSNGNPVLYYTKDSYPDYFYTADPSELHKSLIEISTVRLN